MRKFKNEQGAIPILVMAVIGLLVVGVVYTGYRYANRGSVPEADQSKTVRLPAAVGTEENSGDSGIGEPTIGEKEPLTAEPESGPSEPRPLVNFNQGGNLIDARDTAGTWLLLYDDPATGSPAAQAVLLFNERSICDGRLCDEDQFTQGDRVVVKGNDAEGNKVVTVYELTSE